MENLGQARTTVIDGSKGELGDLENNFMSAAFKLGLQLYDEILRIGFDPDIFTYTALIRGHCVRGDMKEAEELFTKIHKSGLFHIVYFSRSTAKLRSLTWHLVFTRSGWEGDANIWS
ncbi:hypothetical protein C1H46_005067 [Malus baccata]|uniref:Pentatricopeptide repeat-containing protein n=1 Tax=Malus baccata TaxID=106549 RepID=A0A540NE78_MALBA|nr:hypothetical protein C1H46_005067 [Malus baccata]